MRMYAPLVSVQKSPFVGLVGAEPCGIRAVARDVVDAGPTMMPAKVIGPAVLPMFTAVDAAANALTVVATVLATANVVLLAISPVAQETEPTVTMFPEIFVMLTLTVDPSVAYQELAGAAAPIRC